MTFLRTGGNRLHDCRYWQRGLTHPVAETPAAPAIFCSMKFSGEDFPGLNESCWKFSRMETRRKSEEQFAVSFARHAASPVKSTAATRHIMLRKFLIICRFFEKTPQIYEEAESRANLFVCSRYRQYKRLQAKLSGRSEQQGYPVYYECHYPGKDDGIDSRENGPLPAPAFLLYRHECGNTREVQQDEHHI